MKLILAMSVFFIMSTIFSKTKPVVIGLPPKELCPNLGQVPYSQIPKWAIYQNGSLKNHVVVLNQNQEKLFIPIQLISNAKQTIKTQKEWKNFSQFYKSVCGANPPFLPENKVLVELPKKISNVSNFHKKNQIEGIGRVIGHFENSIVLEGKVIYSNSKKNSSSSYLLQDGVFLVKGYRSSLHPNTLASFNLKYLGEFYDSQLKIRIPIYKYLEQKQSL